MKNILAATAAVVLSTGLAAAADMKTKAPPPAAAPAAAAPSIWDIAFGGAVMSDYNFRGITQSDNGPSATAYIEPRLKVHPNFEFYAGIAGWAVKLPTDPSAEIDFYGGVRPVFGPLAFDFGAIYYYYPQETQQFGTGPFGASFTLANTDWWEVYGKVAYTFNDIVTIGGNVYYSPSYLNTGADGTYASFTAKVAAPSSWFPTDWGIYVSGEVGHYWFGTTNADGNAYVLPTPLPDYTYFNIGAALTYKVFTLDVRFHSTDLSKEQCFILTGDPGAVPFGAPSVFNPAGFTSNWCGDAVVVKGSFDLTAMTNLK
jgi:uncharacterized protein (TIGR02001 family)